MIFCYNGQVMPVDGKELNVHAFEVRGRELKSVACITNDKNFFSQTWLEGQQNTFVFRALTKKCVSEHSG